MYRTQANVPPETVLAAEQCKKNYQFARQKQKEDEDKKKAKEKIKAISKAKNLHPKILSRIAKESKNGNSELRWQHEFLFWTWQAPVTLIVELIPLLKRDGFECKIDYSYDNTGSLIIKW